MGLGQNKIQTDVEYQMRREIFPSRRRIAGKKLIDILKDEAREGVPTPLLVFTSTLRVFWKLSDEGSFLDSDSESCTLLDDLPLLERTMNGEIHPRYSAVRNPVVTKNTVTYDNPSNIFGTVVKTWPRKVHNHLGRSRYRQELVQTRV
jgi:hypothetical protein